MAEKIIKCYQRFISPFIGNHCRFHPSCSQYTLKAVSQYGAFRGIWKGVLRIARCHPFSAGGFDPT